jgi:hypothetical protein
MMRQLNVCACALLALLLLGSDASAQGCDPVYGGYGYTASYYAPSYGYATTRPTPLNWRVKTAQCLQNGGSRTRRFKGVGLVVIHCSSIDG